MLPSVTWLRAEKSGDVIVDIHVVPNATQTQAQGLHDGALRVRLHAPPVDGKANAALLEFLRAKVSHGGTAPKPQVELISGDTSRAKRVRIRPASTSDLLHALQP